MNGPLEQTEAVNIARNKNEGNPMLDIEWWQITDATEAEEEELKELQVNDENKNQDQDAIKLITMMDI